VRWGIVGLGAITIDSIAPAIADCPGSRLVACCGRTPEDTRAFAARFAVPGIHDSFDALAADPQVDCVYVATPNALHTAPVIAAARHRKHVLCEKPFAMEVEHAQAMVDACSAAGVVLRVAHQIRLEPALQRVRAIVQSGQLGELRSVAFERTAPLDQTGEWRMDPSQGGILFDVAVHLLDLVQWTTGLRIEEVIAFTQPDRRAGRPDETVSILGRMGGGCNVNIRASRELPFARNDLVMEGTRGMISTSALRWVDEYVVQVRDRNGVSEDRYVPTATYRREVEAFADELRGQPSLLPAGEEGVAMVRLQQAILRSIASRSAEAVA
jgi:1,5-anhydro-D-fructose reductase (1,5-anhydro-D-mannitol-forming)